MNRLYPEKFVSIEDVLNTAKDYLLNSVCLSHRHWLIRKIEAAFADKELIRDPKKLTDEQLAAKMQSLQDEVSNLWAEYERRKEEVNICPDCGAVGEIKGHQTCQYPKD